MAKASRKFGHGPADRLKGSQPAQGCDRRLELRWGLHDSEGETRLHGSADTSFALEFSRGWAPALGPIVRRQRVVANRPAFRCRLYRRQLRVTPALVRCLRVCKAARHAQRFPTPSVPT